MNQFKLIRCPAIISVGSVDGVLTTAALLRLLGSRQAVAQQRLAETPPTGAGSERYPLALARLRSAQAETQQQQVLWTQAFQVVPMSGDRPGTQYLDLSALPASSGVILVDLPVDNTAEPVSCDWIAGTYPKGVVRTATFIRHLRALGHDIVACIDEHSRSLWFDAMTLADGRPGDDTYDSFASVRPWSSHQGGLYGWIVQPQGKGGRDPEWPSSGKVLGQVLIGVSLGNERDYIDRLLDAANEADQGRFAGPGKMVNEAVKTAIADNSRRDYLARYLAWSTAPDGKIQGWLDEYAAVERINQQVLGAGQKVGRLLVLDATAKKIDATSLLFAAYRQAEFVGLKGAEARAFFGGGAKGADTVIKEQLTAAGISCTGSGKIAVSAADFDRAVQVLSQ